MNQFRRLTVSLAVVAIVVFVLCKKPPGGWFGLSSRLGQETAARSSDLKTLAFLSPNKLLATVGSVNLRSEDLLEILQKEFHGSVSHAGLFNQDIAAKANVALDRLIEDELLAEGARRWGMKTTLSGSAGREDLVRRYLALTKIPELSDADLRSFYKNHGEKFYVPAGARVRELFLPVHRSEGKSNKTLVKAKGRHLFVG